MQNPNHAVLRLVTFCLGSVAAIALALALLFVGVSAAFVVGQSTDPSNKPGDSKPGEAKPGDTQPGNTAGGTQSFSGMITDSHCNAKHPGKSGLSGADCVRVCVRSGSAFVLMEGDKVYTLNGDAATLGRFASQRATVHGTLSGNTINVSAIAAPQ